MDELKTDSPSGNGVRKYRFRGGLWRYGNTTCFCRRIYTPTEPSIPAGKLNLEILKY